MEKEITDIFHENPKSGILCTIRQRGQLTIPSSLLKLLELQAGDQLLVTASVAGLTLAPVANPETLNTLPSSKPGRPSNNTLLRQGGARSAISRFRTSVTES